MINWPNINRDINASINLKQVWLDVPNDKTLQRSGGIGKSKTDLISKKVLTVCNRNQKPTLKTNVERVGTLLMGVVKVCHY